MAAVEAAVVEAVKSGRLRLPALSGRSMTEKKRERDRNVRQDA